MKNQTESPFSNPRFLLVLLITFVTLWGWQYYINKKYPPVLNNQVVNSEKPEQTAKLNEEKKLEAVQKSTGEVKNIDPQFAEQKFEYADEKVSFNISSSGFSFTSFILNDFKNKDFKPMQFINEDLFYAIEYMGKPVPFNITVSSDKLTYAGIAQIDGFEIKRTLVYNKENRFFDSTISFSEGLKNINIIVRQDKIEPKSSNFLMPSFDHQDFVNIANNKTVSERISGHKDSEIFSKNFDNVKMASIGSQYFVSSIIDKSDLIPNVTNKIEGKKATLNLEYKLAGTKTQELKQVFYIGPKQTEIMQKIDSSLPEVLNYGMFGFISKFLVQSMKFIYGFVGNWGLAIIILTLLVRGILLPANIMSFRSAQGMQKIKPEMDKIKEKFKADPIRMNKETMALMKEHKANPLSGCLPMLLQIPVFFAFFAAISNSIELYQQPFFGWINDLSHHDTFFILPLLMGVTMYFQQKLMPNTMDATQAKIMNFMPIIFTFFMLTLPSGLTLYNFVSALFGVVQQYFMLKENKLKTI